MEKRRGPKSKFDTKYHSKLAFYMAQLGFTDEQMAKEFGVSRSTLSRWKEDYPEFAEILKENKAIADKQVVDSLFKRANGFEYVETHIEGIDSGKDENGNQIISNRKIKQIKKTVLPDPTSMIFWLCNRDRANWQQRQSMEHGINSSISDLIKKANANPTGITDSKTDS